MNHSDSERIAGFLESLPPSNSPPGKEGGFVLTKNINEANLVIFNTCGVRQMAEDRVYGQIHNLKIKSQNAKCKIVLTGCLANRPDVQKRLKNKVDLFFPINEFEKFKNFVTKNFFKIKNCQPKAGPPLEEKLKISAQKNTTDKENIAYLSIPPKHSNNFQINVPIMTGCNNFCAYCVVPHARGREVSRPAEDIINEVKKLIQNGAKHIILLGQNVNSYRGSGKNSSADEVGKLINFPQLLQKINSVPGKFWISFVSSHPKDVTDEMIETVAKCKKVCENFHLPIQAGNDEILKNMNRKYTAKQYLQIIRKIKSAFAKYKPAVPYSITSDIIVGFPGETKKQFTDSAQVMRKAKFDMIFFGKFSPRPNTAAWEMKDNISKEEKEKRAIYLNEILKETCLANNKKYVGKTLEVLVEKVKLSSFAHQIPPNPPFPKGEIIEYFGKTRSMKNVKMTICDCHPGIFSEKYPGSQSLIGKIIKVKITKANVWNLEGICHPTGGRPQNENLEEAIA